MTYKNLFILLIFSCLKLNAQVSITTIYSSKSNFRAIEVLNDSTVWFANSSGLVGDVNINGKINYYTIPDTLKNHFRAVSSTSKYLYALNIGSPTRLYQFNKKNYKNPGRVVYTEKHPKAFYDAMAFFDTKNGIAMGDPTDNCLSILTTKNSGTTWHKIPCSDLPPISKGEAAFAASNSNITIYKRNAWIATGGMKSRVFYTHNKGKSWKVFNTPFPQGKATTGIYSIDFYDAENGIICGGDYTDKQNNSNNKAITKDGGKTWQIVANGQLPGYISCVQYVPNTKGKEVMAVSTEGVYHSKNYGHKWEQISIEGYYTIRFIDKKTAFLGGRDKIAILKF